jgi:hypothetical protein
MEKHWNSGSDVCDRLWPKAAKPAVIFRIGGSSISASDPPSKAFRANPIDTNFFPGGGQESRGLSTKSLYDNLSL